MVAVGVRPYFYDYSIAVAWIGQQDNLLKTAVLVAHFHILSLVGEDT